MSVHKFIGRSMVFSTLILTLGCKKAEPPLPDAVVGGDNVFACHINGKSFIAHDHADLFGSSSKAVDGGFWIVYEPYRRGDNFELTGSTSDGDMVLYIGFCDSTGTYTLNHTVSCPSPTCTPSYNYASYQSKFFTSESLTGYIHMMLRDTAANESLGTFAFSAKDKSGNKIDVTDGRFYYKYRKP